MNRIEDCIDGKTKAALLTFRDGIRRKAEGAYNRSSIGIEGHSVTMPESSTKEPLFPDVSSNQ